MVLEVDYVIKRELCVELGMAGTARLRCRELDGVASGAGCPGSHVGGVVNDNLNA